METINAVYAEAQQAVIGSVLIDPDKALGIVMDRLRPDNFREEWRTIFEAMRSLWLDQQPVDAVTVLDRCGPGYERLLRGAMQLTPTAANVAAYCDAVRDQSALLRLHDLGTALLGSPTVEDARRILANAETAVMERPGLQAQSVTDLLRDFYMRMSDDTPPKYLPWGIRKLNEGLRVEKGDFVLLGADSSVGKTALATQMAWAMASRGLRVGFFSLETSARKLTDRLVAQQAQLDMSDIKDKRLKREDLKSVAAMGDASKTVRLSIVPCSGATVADLRAVTIAQQFDVVFVDYVQLLQADGRERWEQVTNISLQLHTMSQSLGVAVVGLSQITAEAKGAKKAPTKDDLRESRQLKQDADAILMMSLDNPDDNESLRLLRVVKQKDGPLIDVCLKFDPKHMDFTPTDSRAIFNRKKPRRQTFMDLKDDDDGEVQEAFGL